MTTPEVAVLGLGTSGLASTRLLRRQGHPVYVSDAGQGAQLEERAAVARGLGATVDLGRHDLDRIGRAGRVVASPGVPPDAAAIVFARAHGVPIVSEVEVGLSALPNAHVIAVTGTNGKTTVTALVDHLLRALGRDVAAVGNIGTPVCEVALRDVPPAWLALEISSFQLHDTPSLQPVVGVLTNLSPDHLDRYPSVEAYYADKAMLFQHDRPDARWVINADDAGTQRMCADLVGRVSTFSTAGRLGDAFLDRAHRTLVVRDAPLLERDQLPLLGLHNVANALAATLAVMVADPAHESDEARARLAAALTTFRPPAHRLEVVGEFDGVTWINDSKATNVASSRVALEAMTRPTILLLGGRHKGEAYSSLLPLITQHCQRVLVYGEASDEIMGDLGGRGAPVERVLGDFGAVMRRARAVAEPGWAVLLSPACSSYDMFTNYQERGAAFARAARGEGQ
ncbi:MAG: UDP-N-acetylmuramoyl-L-alanine--D-glutamate ligase [Gemmatimonadetes bacterium]|nr:UDP-N-acetylmuramoyl-L-alanine--D-glutamate ligase [Gemmatimonadota bacterium]